MDYLNNQCNFINKRNMILLFYIPSFLLNNLRKIRANFSSIKVCTKLTKIGSNQSYKFHNK